MKVKVIFRNYIPLYSGYCSFWLNPIKGVEVVIPKVKKRSILFKIYRLFKGLPFFSFFVGVGQKLFFSESMDTEDADLLFYTGMLPQRDLGLPFVIDFEHIHSLFDYAAVNQITKGKVWRIISSKNCIGLLPWSLAAENSLNRLFKNNYHKIINKVLVLYPALPKYKKIYNLKENFKHVPNDCSVKFLFVGRDYKRKGLMELLEAFRLILDSYDAELYVVSNISEKEKNEYSNPHLHFFEAKFSQEEVIKKFFLTCDVFVLPTHADTFGMVLLEALSSGLPVITTRQFASQEIIDENVNGLFVRSEKLFLDNMLIPDKKHTGEGYNEIDKLLVNELYLKMKFMLDNPKVLEMMKNNATGQFEDGGIFSISERNKKLRIIYEKINNK